MTLAKGTTHNIQKGTTNIPGVDRDAIRLDYVTSSITLQACARKHGVKGPTLRKWAREDNWDTQRREYRAKFHEQATQSKIENAAARLAQWNEETLIHAGLLREAARRQFQYQTQDGWRFRDDASSKAIQAAAAAHVAADKLARLALGASTENVNNNNRTLPTTVDDFF